MKRSLTKQQQNLVEMNHNLIYGFANRNNLNIDEYYDLLAIGLCKAAKIFDNNKSEFSTLAYYCMRNEVYQHWKHIKTKSYIPNEIVLSYDALNNTDNIENKNSFLEILTDKKLTEDIVINDLMENAIFNILSKKERIIVEFLVSGLNQIEISEKLGCTKQCISAIVCKIRKKCARYLNKY